MKSLNDMQGYSGAYAPDVQVMKEGLSTKEVVFSGNKHDMEVHIPTLLEFNFLYYARMILSNGVSSVSTPFNVFAKLTLIPLEMSSNNMA